MAHDIFISYSSKDKPLADAACATFEAAGMRCWIAPRDVPPGAAWGGAIVEAIQKSRVMVLIFSENANASGQIAREVERAADYGVTIVPIRVDNVIPAQSLQYFLSNIHWLDALSPPLEHRLQEIAVKIQPMLGGTGSGPIPVPLPPPGTQAQPTPAKSNQRWLIGVIILLIALLGVMVLIWRPWAHPQAKSEPPAPGPSTPAPVTPSQVAVLDPALIGRWSYSTTFLDTEVHIELSIDAAGRYLFRTFLTSAGNVQLKNGRGIVTDKRNGKTIVAAYIFPTEDQLTWTSPTADPNTKIVLNYKRVGDRRAAGNPIVGKWHATTLFAGLMWDADWEVQPDSSFEFLFENRDEGTLKTMQGEWESSSSLGRPSGKGIYRNVTPDSFEMSHPIYQMLRFERMSSNSGR